MRPPTVRRGFSLLELAVAVSLFVVALGIGFSVTHAARTRTSVKARALQLLADLRWARQRAMTLARPCGILLPDTSAAGAYAVVACPAEAPERFAVERVVDCQEGPEPSTLFSGSWDGLPFSGSASCPDARVDPVATVQMERWKRTCPGRYLLFGANGVPVSSALPEADGNRFLVVSAGARVHGDVLAAAGPSYTVRLSRLGEARLEEGVPGFRTASSPVRSAPAAALSLPSSAGARAPNQAPIIRGLSVTPVSATSILPPDAAPGQTFLVRQDGTLSLTVTATDPDGDRLACAWGGHPLAHAADSAPTPEPSSQADLSPGCGSWSTVGLQPMTWDAGTARWTQAVEWAPPVSAASGQWFALGVVVDDLRGGREASWIVVQIVEPDAFSVAFERDSQLYFCTRAGSEVNSYPCRRSEDVQAYDEWSAGRGGGTSGVSTTRHVHRHELGGFAASSLVVVGDYPYARLVNLETGEETSLEAFRIPFIERAGPTDTPSVTVLDVSPDGLHLLIGSLNEANLTGYGKAEAVRLEAYCPYLLDPQATFGSGRGGTTGWPRWIPPLLDGRFGPDGRLAMTNGCNASVVDPLRGAPMTFELPSGMQWTWMSHPAGRILTLDRQNSLRVLTEGPQGWSQPAAAVFTLQQAARDLTWSGPRSTLWFRGEDGVLRYLPCTGDPATWTAHEVPDSASGDSSLRSRYTYAVSEDGNRVYYVTDQGLHSYQLDRGLRRHLLDNVQRVVLKPQAP